MNTQAAARQQIEPIAEPWPVAEPWPAAPPEGTAITSQAAVRRSSRVRAGDSFDCFDRGAAAMVESGALIAELTMTNGATLPLVRFSAGDVVPALDTLSAPAFSLSYRAEQPTQIAWLDDDHRAGWVRERATRAREAMLFSSMRQLTCLACLPATYRVYVELLRAARLARGRAFALPTHGELAARASTTRETVSRELSALRQDGVLSKGKVVTIVAPDALLRRIGRALNLEDAGDVWESIGIARTGVGSA